MEEVRFSQKYKFFFLLFLGFLFVLDYFSVPICLFYCFSLFGAILILFEKGSGEDG